MAIHSIASRELTRELLLKMSDVLKSVADDLTPEQLQAAIARAVGDADFNYKSNNDMGLLVSRIVSREIFAGEGLDGGTTYVNLRKADLFIDDRLNALADRLAIPLSHALESLRTTIPAQVDEICNTIKTSLEDPKFVAPEGAVEVFYWGALSDPSFQEVAIIAGQQHANVFKGSTPTRQESEIILSKLPVEIAAIDSQYRTTMIDAIVAKVTADAGENPYTDSDVTYVVDALIKPLSFKTFITDMRTYMAGFNAPISTMISGLKKLDTYRAIFNVLRSVDLEIPEVVFDTLRANFQVFDKASMMSYAAVLSHRQDMQDRLFLSNRHANEDAFRKFFTGGGVAEDLQIISTHLTHVQKAAVDTRGVKTETLLAGLESIRAGVAKFEQNNQIAKDEETRRVKTKALRSALRAFAKSQERPAWMTPVTYEDTVSAAILRAEERIGTPQLSMQEIVTDFVVKTTTGSLTQQIYAGAKEGLSETLAAEETLDKTTMSRVLFSSVSNHVCGFLKTNYVEAA